MKKRLISVLLTLAMTISLVACGNTSGDMKNTETIEEGGGTFIVPINTSSLGNLSALGTESTDDKIMAFSPGFDSLFIVNKGETRWYLANSFEPTSDDGCHYRMTLNEGMTWHDGEPITADDVIFTVQALQEPTNGFSNGPVMYNGDPVVVEKIDDLTVDVSISKPYSGMASLFGRIKIAPAHVFGNDIHVIENQEALMSGIGSGPFKVKEFKEGEYLIYERYDDYYRGKASLDEVIIKMMPEESTQEIALQNGELSVMRISNQEKLEKYSNDEKYEIFSIDEGRLNYFVFNNQHPLVQNIDARKAICLALNAEEILVGAYGSEELAIVAKNFCSPQNKYYNDDMEGYEQDLTEAKKLAEKSGIVGQTLTYIYNQQRPNMKETAQIIQQQLKEIGVNCEIEGMDTSAFLPHIAGVKRGKEDTSWAIATNGQDQMNADPATKMTSWYGDETFRKGLYYSDETAELWEKASSAVDEAEREKYFKELQVQMNKDYTMYPLTNTNYVMVVQKGFKGLDTIEKAPVFEDYLAISYVGE